jgi:hypothetical protein
MKSETFIRVAQLSELNGDGPFALSVGATGARSKAVVHIRARCSVRGNSTVARSSVAITVRVSRSVPGSAKVGRNPPAESILAIRVPTRAGQHRRTPAQKAVAE